MSWDTKKEPCSSTSWHGNVALNCFGDQNQEFGSYADAFYGAGKILAEKIRRANGYSDMDACPIMFLYRHSLELQIKACVIAGKRLFDIQEKEFPVEVNTHSSHRLSHFTPALAVIFKEMSWHWDFGHEALRNFQDFKACLAKVEAMDLDSFAFRYSVNKKGKPNFERHFSFNVLHFCDYLGHLIEGLSGCVLGLEHTSDDITEALAASYGHHGE